MSDIAQGVFVKKATLNYTDTAAKNLFTLPKNAMVLFFLVDVDTGFNDSGTDLLDLGKTGTATYFADDINVATAGQVMVQQTNLGDIGSAVIQVTGTYAGQNSNATAGQATVTCVFAHYSNKG